MPAPHFSPLPQHWEVGVAAAHLQAGRHRQVQGLTGGRSIWLRLRQGAEMGLTGALQEGKVTLGGSEAETTGNVRGGSQFRRAGESLRPASIHSARLQVQFRCPWEAAALSTPNL